MDNEKQIQEMNNKLKAFSVEFQNFIDDTWDEFQDAMGNVDSTEACIVSMDLQIAGQKLDQFMRNWLRPEVAEAMPAEVLSVIVAANRRDLVKDYEDYDPEAGDVFYQSGVAICYERASLAPRFMGREPIYMGEVDKSRLPNLLHIIEEAILQQCHDPIINLGEYADMGPQRKQWNKMKYVPTHLREGFGAESEPTAEPDLAEPAAEPEVPQMEIPEGENTMLIFHDEN